VSEISILAVDVTGREHQTEWSEASASDAEAVGEILSDFKSLSHLKVETADGVVVYINPTHIVSVQVSTR
jgi:hypothetical protein